MSASAAGISRRPLQSGAPAEPPIRLLIVDDSAVARAVLSRMISAHDDLEVVALAANAAEALDALRSLCVDIVLLDVEMPGASGLEALPEILRLGAGARVLIVSSNCEDGAEAAVRALALGAADTLPKPGSGRFGGRFSDVLAERLRRIGRCEHESVSAGAAQDAPSIHLRAMSDARPECIAIGASTGGLHALSEFLRALPAETGAPILITQHLPALFMPFFARQMEAASGRVALVAEAGQQLVADRIYVAPGEAHLTVERGIDDVAVKLSRAAAASGNLPSVDPMLASVASAYGDRGVGVILSGMGKDGLLGAGRLIDAGGSILAQDRGSSAVWGMPRAVAEAGLACAMLPPAALARRVAAQIEAHPWN